MMRLAILILVALHCVGALSSGGQRSLAEHCEDDNKFGLNGNTKKGCEWAAEKKARRCRKRDKRTGKKVSFYCPASPTTEADLCTQDDPDFRYNKNEVQDCGWVAKKPNGRCGKKDKYKKEKKIQESQCNVIAKDGLPVSDFCPKKCNTCIVASASPTVTPTALSEKPTVSPSSRPTASPSGSQSPTFEGQTPAPTVSPSVSPSQGPTVTQSEKPSLSPTGPTASPSADPTLSPTGFPTTPASAAPSSFPSASPSASPSSDPSVSPTRSPTATPSVSPTSRPTSSPSLSLSPTFKGQTREPSAAPSSSPSRAPSASPSSSPSASPSATPSATPSISSPPSAAPSSMPTEIPEETSVLIVAFDENTRLKDYLKAYEETVRESITGGSSSGSARSGANEVFEVTMSFIRDECDANTPPGLRCGQSSLTVRMSPAAAVSNGIAGGVTSAVKTVESEAVAGGLDNAMQAKGIKSFTTKCTTK
eukprot:jgi/Psemu1/32552/gm1.32552_g